MGQYWKRSFPDSVDQRRVVVLVGKYCILRAQDGLKESHVGGEAGGEEQASLFVQELGQLLLQLPVKVARSSKQPGARGSTTKLLKS